MKAKMNGAEFTYNSDLDFLWGLIGPEGFVEKFPEGGTLVLEAPTGETFELEVPTNGSGKEKEAKEFNQRFYPTNPEVAGILGLC